jgi:hypothetical protein
MICAERVAHLLVILLVSSALTVSVLSSDTENGDQGRPGLSSDWRIEVVGYHGGSAPPDIALDSSNGPHVLYCPPGEVDLAVREPIAWSNETVFGPTGVGGVCGVLSLDSLDNPFVGFDRLAHKTEGGWNYTPVPWIPYDMAVSSGGTVHITYFKRTAPDEVTVQEAYLRGGNWTTEDVDIFSAPSSLGSSWLSLALGPDSLPHLLYYADALGEIRYAYKDNGTWNIETVDTIGNIMAVGKHGSLSLDSGGVPHIVYVARTQPTRLETHYATRGPLGWSIGSMANGFFPTIGMISDDTPLVSYLAGYPDYELRLAHLTGDYWDFESIPDPTTGPAIAQFPTMAMDRCDNPHVVWYDFDVPGVLYATKGEPCPPEPEEEPSITLDIDP